jgi:hypothetical protein
VGWVGMRCGGLEVVLVVCVCMCVEGGGTNKGIFSFVIVFNGICRFVAATGGLSHIRSIERVNFCSSTFKKKSLFV